VAAGLQIVFRAAAGPRLGFGHLMRCRALGHALGVPPRVSLRATPATRTAAARLGFPLVADPWSLLAAHRGPRVLVVDDPSARHAQAWVRRARRLGIPVATVHDLGLGYVPADLAIDGSVRPHRAMRRHRGHLGGPAYAVLHPQVARWRGRRTTVAEPRRVLVALGGGAHVLSLAASLAGAIAARAPHATIRIAAGFAASRPLPALPAGQWITVTDGLAEELARCEVALLAGGLGLYEACAIGVPSVALALTPAQGLAIRSLARAGVTVDAGPARDGARDARRTAALVADLLANGRARRRLGAAGRALVDGGGASRVAARIRQLAIDRLGVSLAA